MAARVLVVEDDVTIAEVLRAYLTRAGYHVEWTGDGSEAVQLWQRMSPDVVVLDIMLPGLSGLEVLRRRRRSGDHARVIVLSARGEEEDRLIGLETGADDYVVKPFSPRELTSRVRAILRRSSPASDEDHLDFVGLHIDLTSREVSVEGRAVGLTAREFELLAFLASSPRRVYSRAQLLERVWSSALEWQDPATVTEHVRRIRLKIEPDRDSPHRIRTVRGVGYAFDP